MDCTVGGGDGEKRFLMAWNGSRGQPFFAVGPDDGGVETKGALCDFQPQRPLGKLAAPGRGVLDENEDVEAGVRRFGDGVAQHRVPGRDGHEVTALENAKDCVALACEVIGDADVEPRQGSGWRRWYTHRGDTSGWSSWPRAAANGPGAGTGQLWEHRMIGKLNGKVDAIGESVVILDVGGVGYEVQASVRTLRALQLGEKASLTIDTHVREDAIRLYGFATEVERSWFRTLQTIQGVGAKVALAVLGILSPSELANAIAFGNWQAVEQAQGVGKKLAQRIVAELKDKAPGLAMAGVNAGQARVATAGAIPVESSAAGEAMSALTNLGYQPAEAARAVATAVKDLGEDADTAKLIRRGLKELAG